MAKKICVICDKGLGALSFKFDVKDGVVCGNCYNLAKIDVLKLKDYDTASLKEHITQKAPDYFTNRDKESAFVPTKSIDKYFFVDENNKQFRVGKDGVICNYADLLDFELLEDGETLLKGGFGGAIIGGMVAGVGGATLGAVLGKKTKGVCNSMDIVLTVKNSVSDTLYITFIGGIFAKDTPRTSLVYQDAQSKAQQCLSALKIIADENAGGGNEPAAGPAVDTAAELQKYHELMKSGVITEDDYNAKKAQLLGL
jgi:hypothetical protein